MFDKLIVCEPEGADFKDRRNYFMVSSFVVGVLFLAAVVFSIYAADYGLGNENFEFSMLMASPETAATEPEPQRQQPDSPSRSQLPTRQVNMLNINETPKVPPAISVAPNTQQARPNLTRFEIGSTDTDSNISYRDGRDSAGTGNNSIGLATPVEPVEAASIPEPPPVRQPVVIKKPDILRSEGPINGKATYLPKPPYPAMALAANIQGKVDVQVTIDETGKVVSANAVSGHPFFRAVAERAAWSAKFSPTYLSKVPVKVTGVIVYNFTR
jgi:protein TonB